MADMYVVYVDAPEMEPSTEDRHRLAKLLRLDSPKLDSLLGRLPAEVTKPVPESTAATVARRFREAGLDASIRPSEPVARRNAAPEEPTEPKPEPSGPVDEIAGYSPPSDSSRSEQDEIWKTQFGGGQRSKAASEDELFPPSAFDHAQGPKAPSKPLVIALVVVLAVLAVLWVLL